MKKYFNKYIMFAAAGLVALASCEEPDLPVDQVVDGTTRGAALRTVNLISNELPIGIEGPGFSAEFEIQDAEQGTLVTDINVYLAFSDNTVEPGADDFDVAEALFTTLSSDTFTTGPFGLPRTSISISLGEMLSFVGLTEGDLFGGDFFPVRFELVLSDGRTFSSTNSNANNLGGSFFNSPFIYFPTVVCPVDSEAFLGDYVINQVVPGIFASNTWGNGTTVTLTQGATSTQRQFEAVYLPDFGIGNGANVFAFDLVCESVVPLPNQASGLQCSAGILFGPPVDADPGSYDPFDDSSLNIVFRDDVDDDCGPGLDAEVRLTKL